MRQVIGHHLEVELSIISVVGYATVISKLGDTQCVLQIELWELDIGASDFFFFQAEDGIRDLTVTGVQTCALPICDRGRAGDALHAELRPRLRFGRAHHARRQLWMALALHPYERRIAVLSDRLHPDRKSVV